MRGTEVSGTPIGLRPAISGHARFAKNRPLPTAWISKLIRGRNGGICRDWTGEARPASRSSLLGWARPVRLTHVPLRVWVNLTCVRNGIICPRNGGRPNCGEIHHPITSGLRWKCPRSVRPKRKKSLRAAEVRPVSPQHPANGCVVEVDLPRRIDQRRASRLAEARTPGSHAGGEAVPKF